MEKIYIKYKCLISGFPLTIERYSNYGFTLQKKELNESDLIPKKNLGELDPVGLLLFCQYKLEDGKYYINYFENDELLEIEIEDSDYKLLQEKNSINFQKYTTIKDKVIDLERKIKIELNLLIAIHFFNIAIFDEKGKRIGGNLFCLKESCFWFRLL